jgi:hypothetical protein
MIIPFLQPDIKTCKRCHQHLGIEYFHKNKNRKDGYSNECKNCSSERSSSAYIAGARAKKRKAATEWKDANPLAVWISYAVYRAKRRAKQKGLPFSLTTKQVAAIIPDVCPIFGTPFIYGGNGVVSDSSPSIDRIDPKKGYVIENIAIISVKANTIKSAYTASDLLKVAQWLAKVEHDKTP